MRCDIGGRRIGPGEPLFVIAELGLNHGGSLDRALALVEAAAEAGASAIKLQTFRAEELVAAGCPAPAHVAETSLRGFFRQFELDRAAHTAVAVRARANGLAFMSAPFSLSAVDMLVDVGVDAIKIASGDLTYDPLIARAAETRLPLVLSTGMATLAETVHAVSVARDHGAASIALLHCVSAYPVPDGSENLRAIQTLARTFDLLVGLSDHAADTSAIPLVVALGGSIYERHLMLPGESGIDAGVSSSPSELADAVAAARRASLALGHGRCECLPAEAANLTASRRALHATRALAPGHIVSPDDIVALRPASGLSPTYYEELVGCTLTRAIEAAAPFLDADLPARHRAWRNYGVA